MAGYGFNLKFWTLQQNNVSEKDVSLHQYYGKDATTEGEYYELKKDFKTCRGNTWMPRNKRPDKLREAIKVFEEVLKTNKVIYIHWKNNHILQLMFNSGLLMFLHVSSMKDIVKITFEKDLVGKLPSASSGVYGEQFVCFACETQTKLTFSTLKPDFKTYSVDLPGPQSKIKRKLCLNITEELMICWWQLGAWIQTAREDERVNMTLLRCSFGRLEVLNAVETENDLIDVSFSKVVANQILTLEKSYNSQNESRLDCVVYECTRNRIERLSVVSFPIKSGVLSFARNRSEDKLVVGCSDGSIAIFDLTIDKMLASMPRSAIVPTIACWVDGLLIIGSAQGELKLYDSALNSILLFNTEERDFPKLQLSEYLTSGNSLIKVFPCTTNEITLLFDGGPVAMLELQGKLTDFALIQQHIQANKVRESVNLLCSLNWNYECDQAYHGLLEVADWLLQQPLNHEREGLLEATFASFYAPKHPHSDAVVLRCRTTVGCYARRFFHHLLRYQRFEKAILLAKDINSSDLFLDIYFAAKDLGDMQLAKVAKLKADEIIAADSSENDTEEDWGAKAQRHISDLVADRHERAHLTEALEKEYAKASSSTLKVTNLGYV